MADAPRSDASSEGGSFGASYMEEYFEDVDSDEEEEEEEEALTLSEDEPLSRDTSAADVQSGRRDMQGIPWQATPYTRAAYRQIRRQQVHHYYNREEEVLAASPRLDAECTKTASRPQLYRFYHNWRGAQALVVHFQLRNLLWTPSAQDLFYVRDGRVMRYSAASRSPRCVLNAAGPRLPCDGRGRALPGRGPGPPQGGLQLCTLCVKHGVVAAGGFGGELCVCRLGETEAEEEERGEVQGDGEDRSSRAPACCRSPCSSPCRPRDQRFASPLSPFPSASWDAWSDSEGEDWALPGHGLLCGPCRARRLRACPARPPSRGSVSRRPGQPQCPSCWERRWARAPPPAEDERCRDRPGPEPRPRWARGGEGEAPRPGLGASAVRPSAQESASSARRAPGSPRFPAGGAASLPASPAAPRQKTLRSGGAIRMSSSDNGITNCIDIAPGLSGPPAVVCSNNDELVRVLDAGTLLCTRTMPLPWAVNATAAAPAQGPCPRLLASVGDGLEALLFDPGAPGARPIARLRGHVDFSFAVAWHPSGLCLATGSQDCCTRVWDLRRAERPVALLRAEGGGAVRSLRYAPDGSALAAAEPADFVTLYDARREYAHAQCIDLFGEIAGVAFTPEGRRFSIAVADAHYGSTLQFERVGW